MSRTLALAVAVFLATGPSLAAGASQVALLLDDGRPTTRSAATAGVLSLGGRVVHAFDDVLVAELPAGAEFRALGLPGVRDVALNRVASRPKSRSLPAWGLAAWNEITRLHDGSRPLEEDGPAFVEPDALIPPTVSLDAVRAASRLAVQDARGVKGAPAVAAATSTGTPFGATELNTSEFLAGAISVNVILVESDGSHEPSSENWSADRESEVVARVAAALEWLRLQEPQAGLQFVYHVVSGRVSALARTGYEPIRRAADPTGSTGEDLWTKEILGKLGYTSGDRFVRSRALASDTRRVDGTDWAVNVFVADSLNDSDGKFADGRFAYTWIGGPHVVMTYDNQAWGIARMDMVLRHEMLHAFYAYDEYSQSGCACAEHRGYLDGANTNCIVCNPIAANCVMISNGDEMCPPTRRQIGWADLDSDGVIDVVGEDPDTFLDASSAQICSIAPMSGLASVVAATNRNPYTFTPRASISVNRIASVEVRVDDAPWQPASPEDGAWGAPQERFRATVSPLSAGPHRLEARAIDDHGNVDLAPIAADVLAAGDAEPLGNTVHVGRDLSGGATVTWSTRVGAATYRVYRAESASGAWAATVETTATSWADESTASGYYRVQAVDACGAEQAD